ncbi:hypothetical protein [Loigolactobacillus binensis]|uniref:Uncharacterized protein n=1 Tax=Loigolactobacillus binensis TaxID=2559922 RepID=A0ABW3ECA0_9LACO|nr:hypothetical protein [Loigolactobacillus binensis]
MTFEGIVEDVVKTIKNRRQRQSGEPFTLPVTFTSKHKIAPGCVVFIVATDGHYQAQKFDVRYPDIDEKVQAIYHGAYFECDDDVDQMAPLIAAVAAQLK